MSVITVCRGFFQAGYHAAQAAQVAGFSAGMRANQSAGGGARARATTAAVQAGGASAGTYFSGGARRWG